MLAIDVCTLAHRDESSPATARVSEARYWRAEKASFRIWKKAGGGSLHNSTALVESLLEHGQRFRVQALAVLDETESVEAARAVALHSRLVFVHVESADEVLFGLVQLFEVRVRVANVLEQLAGGLCEELLLLVE